jgi:hypothetical protein
MKFFILKILLLIFCLNAYPSAKKDSVLRKLKREISKKKEYDARKLFRIKQLRSNLGLRGGDPFDVYLSCLMNMNIISSILPIFMERKSLRSA